MVAERTSMFGSVEAAERSFRDLYTAYPEDPDVVARYGAFLARQGRCAELDALFDGLRTAPWFGMARAVDEALCAARHEDRAGAIERLTDALVVGGAAPAVRLQLASQWTEWGDRAAAAEALATYEQEHAGAPELAFARAHLALGTEDFEVELASLHREIDAGAAASDPVLRLRASVLIAQDLLLHGAPELARSTLNATGVLGRHHGPWVAHSAEAFRRLGQEEMGEALIARYLREGGTMGPTLAAVRSRIAVDAGDLTGAEALLAGQAASADPNVVASRWYLARARGEPVEPWATLYERVRRPADGALDPLLPVAGG